MNPSDVTGGLNTRYGARGWGGGGNLCLDISLFCFPVSLNVPSISSVSQD